MYFSTLLVRLAGTCSRFSRLVLVLGFAIGALCVWLAVHGLGVSSDVDTLFAASLPWKQREAELKRDFPQFNDLLVAVVDARLPEQADETAAALATAASTDKVHFRTVNRPDALPFFQQNGLMFLDTAQLSTLLDTTIDAQPFLGQLANDPSARGLFAALSLLGRGVELGQANLKPFATALQAFHTALSSSLKGTPQPLSWESLLAGSLAELGGKYRFVLLQPVLDYSALQPGGAATEALRQAVSSLDWVRSGDAHVRITGSIALADEEFATATEGAIQGLIGSTLLVVVWLFLAVRSWRLIVPILLTLFLGLACTTGFAAVAVGTLNLVSLAFAVLFVGIAVDFAIQFSVRLRSIRVTEPDLHKALMATAHQAGMQILVAGSAIAAGFLAFVPTSFVGVAQLGLIAGIGMLVALCCTLTFLPAALSVFNPHPEHEEVGFAWMRPLDRGLARAHVPVVAIFAVLAVCSVILAPHITFDSDPLHTKDPHTEAMRTLYDLMEDPRTNPYSIDILRPDAAQASALADKLRHLPLVHEVMTLDSFVPQDQSQKLALIADAANILGPTLAARAPATAATPADIRLAASTAAGQIERALPKLPANDPLHDIAKDLQALQSASDAQLMAMNQALTCFLPLQLERLRTLLSAVTPVTTANIPMDVARDWRLPDGRVRVQVTASPQARSSEGLHRFVAQVQTVAQDAGGSAVTIVATADTIVTAFRHAATGAIIAIAVILALVLRRARDVLLVLSPLLLSAALTVLLLVLVPLPLNFANIIALPLLLGVGVSFNIYFVMNWRDGMDWPLESATARAVLFSALTTSTAFGSLALSKHPGTASMGVLLLVSLGCTLVASLVFVPAALAMLRKPRA